MTISRRGVSSGCGAPAATSARAPSVVGYLADLHTAVRHVFGLEAVPGDCCFGDVVATEPIHPEDATRQVELPAVGAFASSDTLVAPGARSGSD